MSSNQWTGPRAPSGAITRRTALGSVLMAPVLAACGAASGTGTSGAGGAGTRGAGTGGAGTGGAGAGGAASSDRSAAGTSGAVNTSSSWPAAPVRIPYGSDPSQFGELHQPAGARRAGTVVVIHGGFWRAEYGLDLGTPLAADLAARGWVAWNLEYRRVGDGGGWRATFHDIAAGIDVLAGLSSSGGHGVVDTSEVVAVGHSAGGQLAAWAAARPALGAASPTAFGAHSVPLTGVVSQAGVLDLAKAVRGGVGGTAVQDLLGGEPDAVADRYRIADPTRHLPLGIPVHCIHGDQDGNVPLDQSVDYVAAATKAGDTAVLHEIQGDHFTLIDVDSAAWTTVIDVLSSLLG